MDMDKAKVGECVADKERERERTEHFINIYFGLLLCVFVCEAKQEFLTFQINFNEKNAICIWYCFVLLHYFFCFVLFEFYIRVYEMQ